MRNNYPRPNLKRKEWVNLNGEWEFAFDKNYTNDIVEFDNTINVPFVYQSELSGIGIVENHDVVWYRKKFAYTAKKERIILHFGAVDYEAEVFLNGKYIGKNCNGSLPFQFDVSKIIESENELVVRVFDPSFDESIPRGKQYWKEKSESIWYTKSTGIWQTVWIEETSEDCISNIKFTPDVDNSSIRYEIDLIGDATSIEFAIKKGEELLVSDIYSVIENRVTRETNLLDSHIFRTNFHDDGWLWTPESPNLFDVEIKVIKNGEIVDIVDSYFGMRKVHVEDGLFYLNNKPYYMRLVLDQGYWPTSLLTAPEDNSFEIDIKLSKDMGFNGCRKHQKVEDPHFLYECDRLGYIVWSEIPSAPIYNDNVVERMTNEYMKMVQRDYNHPSIFVWVCLNESWSTPKIQFDNMQQNFSLSLYHMVKAIDGTRLAISNDGWCLTKTDICAIHNYNHGSKDEIQKYEEFRKHLNRKDDALASMAARYPVYANGFSHDNSSPIMLTEFGGIALKLDNESLAQTTTMNELHVGVDSNNDNGAEWGYTSASTPEEFIEDLKRVMKAIYDSESIYGFCYTQITDVEQEINGLLNYDRTQKIDLNIIKEIIQNEN